MNKSTGITTLGALGVAFIVLKLCGVIGWSWLWVLCPFWIGIAVWMSFWIIMLMGALAVILIGAAFSYWGDR